LDSSSNNKETYTASTSATLGATELLATRKALYCFGLLLAVATVASVAAAESRSD
jgi:hypothetical protein